MHFLFVAKKPQQTTRGSGTRRARVVSPRWRGPWSPRNGVAQALLVTGPAHGEQRAGNVLVVQTSVACPTCRQGDCLRRSERRRNCVLMANIPPEQVIAGIDKMLGDPSGARSAR